MRVKQLRVKLAGFESFKEVIKAIQMVAASDLKELKDELGERFEFLNPFLHYFDQKGDEEEEIDEELEETTNTETEKTVGVFPLTIDKNCCGPHNFNVFDGANSVFESLAEDNTEFVIITTGPRALTYYKAKYPKKIIKNFPKFHMDDLSLLLTTIIAEKLNGMKKVNHYVIVFNRFVTVFRTVCSRYDIPSFENFIGKIEELEDTHLFPLSRSLLRLTTEGLFSIYIFCFAMILLDSLNENQYTAVSGRIGSMTQAFKNIKEVIFDTFLLYNKSRQEGITNEICELSVHMIM